ncbi:MAG TPA: T9SS type A sorting domain-containing protein, partial [Flavobacteriales bacterium]|nr:T9SS type A sorting domain-containing protein [Flavobacteriales bacterium]HMR29195.1 T9SS type A sorting domain-containing protein [Flavobacteriales bacterium]
MSPRISLSAALWVAASVVATAQEWQWAKTFGQGSGQDQGRIAQDGVGNLYMTGDFSSMMFGTDSLSALPCIPFMKMNRMGEVVWLEQPVRVSQTSCGTGNDFGAPYVAVHPAGSAVYFSGTMCSSWDFGPYNVSDDTSGAQVFLASYNADGVCNWARSFGSEEDDHVRDMESTPDGDILIMYSGGATIVDGVVILEGESILKFSSSGTCEWAVQMPTYPEGSVTLMEPVDDGFYVHGRTYSNFGGQLQFDTVFVDVSVRKLVLAKFNYLGRALWGKAYGESLTAGPTAYVSAMAVNDHGVVVVGDKMYLDTMVLGMDTLVGDDPLFMVRFDPNGEYIRSTTTGGGYGPNLAPMDMAIGTSDDVYLLGRLRAGNVGDSIDIGGCTSVIAGFEWASMLLAHVDADGRCIELVRTEIDSYSPLQPNVPLEGWSLVLDPDEQPVVCGQFRGTAWFDGMALVGNSLDQDVFIAKVNALDGIPPWELDELLLYANPNQGSFRIKVPTGLRNEVDLLLSVFDSSGRLVRARQLDMSGGDPRMDVSGVAPGLYKVTLSKGDRIYHGSMVVE